MMHARREAGMHNPAMPSNGLRCPLYSTHPHGETPLSSASSIDRQTIHGFNDVQALAGPDMAAVNALIRSLRNQGVHAIAVVVHEGGTQTGAIGACTGMSGAIVDIASPAPPAPYTGGA